MAKTTRTSRFRHGTGCFSCRVCGRKSRETATNSGAGDICPQCYELAGIENSISDGASEASAEEREAILRYTSEITAKGGSIQEWADLLATVGGGL